MARENYKVAPNVNVESDNLLRIIHDGIDNIIVQLKEAVDLKGYGTDGTIGKTNDAVVKILKVFSDFQLGLVPGTGLGTGHMKESVVNPQTKSKVDTPTFLTPAYFEDIRGDPNTKLDENYDMSINNLPSDNIADILDLGTGINYNTYNTNNDGFGEPIIITNTNQDQLNQRLLNCKTLEQLYLNKHNEIIKIFGFVVNLFDKYKYAIKVILFLLKNLVRAEQRTPPSTTPTTPGSVSVRLPKPLITNINLLLKDQANIQTIIDGMEKVVDETDKNISTSVDKTTINRNLENITIPQPAIPPAPPAPTTPP